MKLLTGFTVFTLIGLLAAAPASNDEDDDKVVITKSFYVDEFIRYKSKHDIVNLLVPLNSLNIDESDSSSSESNETEEDTDIIFFFVEADVQPDGSRVDQGLYVYKEGKVKKILENGRDAAASGDDSKLVFFGAQDGLYVYKQETNTAEKYGPIIDSIIGIAKEKSGDVMYILTEDNVVYKVSDGGEKKEKLEDVVNAKQIILDYSNNLYFYSEDKQPYVRTADGVKKIEGLPETSESVYLIKPPFLLDDSVPFLIDNTVYIIYANGSSELSDFSFKPKVKPTAYAPEAALVQYYAYDKKIYEYDLLKLIVGAFVDEIDKYLSDKQTGIRSLASQTKDLKMHLLLFLHSLTSVDAYDCSTFDGEKYTRKTAVTIKGLPTNLVINPITKDLLFTLIDIESLQSDDVQTKMDQYLVREGEPIKVDNINGQAAAVDEENNIVYIASDDGLTVLNKTSKANFVAFKGDDITQLFKPASKDKLYAILFPDSEVFVIDLKTNEKKRVENVPCAFILAVDENENIFYECDSKYVKMLLKGFQEPIEFVGIPKNSARAVAIDSKRRVILAANDGLYWLRPDTLIPKKLMDLDFVPSGIAFLDTNIYLSTSGVIYEYTSSKNCEN